MGNQLSEVKKIAHKARKWTEKIAEKYPNEFGEDLNCLCGVASAKLVWMLKQEGIKARIASSYCHAFVLWKDYVIDITATQISHGRKKVEIFKQSIIEHMDVKNLYWYDIKDIFDSVSGFIKHQRYNDEWPHEQRYSTYKNLFKEKCV